MRRNQTLSWGQFAATEEPRPKTPSRDDASKRQIHLGGPVLLTRVDVCWTRFLALPSRVSPPARMTHLPSSRLTRFAIRVTWLLFSSDLWQTRDQQQNALGRPRSACFGTDASSPR